MLLISRIPLGQIRNKISALLLGTALMQISPCGTSEFILMRTFSCLLVQITRLDCGRFQPQPRVLQVSFWIQTIYTNSRNRHFLEDLESIIASRWRVLTSCQPVVPGLQIRMHPVTSWSRIRSPSFQYLMHLQARKKVLSHTNMMKVNLWNSSKSTRYWSVRNKG